MSLKKFDSSVFSSRTYGFQGMCSFNDGRRADFMYQRKNKSWFALCKEHSEKLENGERAADKEAGG